MLLGKESYTIKKKKNVIRKRKLYYINRIIWWRGILGGEETSTMKEHFIMKSFFRKRELYSEKNIRENNILHKKGEKKDSFIRKRELYYLKKKEKTLLGKENSII